MQSTYDLLAIPREVAIAFVFVSLVALLTPYFAGQDFGIVKIPRLAVKTPFKILGPVLLLLSLAGFYPHWAHGSQPATSATWARFTPIPNLENLAKSFAVRTSPPPVRRLRFQTDRWPVSIVFDASATLPTSELREALLAHFGFANHVSFDLSGFPIDGTWAPRWVLTVNGRVIEPNDISDKPAATLAAAGVRDSDLLRLRLVWTEWVYTSGGAKRKAVRPPGLDY